MGSVDLDHHLLLDGGRERRSRPVASVIAGVAMWRVEGEFLAKIVC